MGLDEELAQRHEERIQKYAAQVKAHYEETGQTLGEDFRTEATKEERRKIRYRRRRGESIDNIANTLRLSVGAVYAALEDNE